MMLIPTPLLLVLMVWCSGLSRVATQPKTLEKLAAQAQDRLPQLMDRTAQVIEQAPAFRSKPIYQWLQALKKAGLKPSDLLQKTDLLTWSKQEINNFTEKLSELLQGSTSSQELQFDLVGLKQRLNSPKTDLLLKQLFAKLSVCTSTELTAWRSWQLQSRHKGMPPACRPSLLIMPSVMRSKYTAIMQMPSQVVLIPESRKNELLAFFRYGNWLPWLLLLLPLVFFLIGGIISGGGLRWFFHASGGATLLGGLLALPTPFVLKDLLLKTLLLKPWEESIRLQLQLPQPDLHNWLFEQVLPTTQTLTAPLFQAVETTAMVTCLGGIILIGLGFLFPARKND